VKCPPLAAIRAFEAVGRTGSVNLAATELGVTSGAITQHVHSSKDMWGVVSWSAAEGESN